MDIQNETSNSNESNIHVNNETTRSDPNVFLTEPNIQTNEDAKVAESMSLLTENVGSEPENTHLTKSLEQKINENEDTLLIEFESIQPLQESIKQSSLDDIKTSDNLMERLEADIKNKEERTQQNEVSSSSHENSTSMVAAGGSSSSKNPNSFTLVSELAELSSPNTRVDMNMHRNWENISNSNSTTSTTSPSHSSATTSVSTSTSTSSSDCLLSPPPRSSINIQVDKLLAPVDANPRKNSPIPISPSNNLYLDVLETSSMEHLNSIQNIRAAATSAANSFVSNRQNSVLLNVESEPSRVSSSNLLITSQREPVSPSQSTATKASSVHSNGKSKNNVKIETCMDKWYKEMKGQILTEVAKVQALKEQQKKIIDEKEKQLLEINRLRLEIEFHKETIRMLEKNQLKKDEVIENLSKTLEKQREKNDVQRRMMEWKVNQIEEAKEAFSCKIADKFYQHRLKQACFYEWRRWLLEIQKTKIEKACKKKAEDVCLDMATRYETKIKKMEEERLKVQDELRLSRIENERYRSELAKSEENMRKALMRGVCALNLEAMSIFNENVVHPVPPQQPIVPSPTPTPSSTLTHNSTTRVNSAQLTQSLPRKLIVQNGHITTSRERERDLLARKVKQFCKVNFENEQNTTATSTSNRKSSLEPHICADAVVAAASAEAANKFKLKLLNDNSVNNGVPKNTIAGRLSDSSLKSLNESSSGVKIYSNNKTFDELVEHSISIPTKSVSKLSNVRSKIDSHSSTTKSERIINMTVPVNQKQANPKQTAKSPHQQHRVIIEKHKSNAGSNGDLSKLVFNQNESRFTTPITSLR